MIAKKCICIKSLKQFLMLMCIHSDSHTHTNKVYINLKQIYGIYTHTQFQLKLYAKNGANILDLKETVQQAINNATI